MKKLIFLSAFIMALTLGANAQKPDNAWKVSLVQTLVKQYPYTVESAKQLVDLKETYFRRFQAYQMPHVETQMGREAKSKAIDALRTEELARFVSVLKDEAKAKEVSAFLEGRIPLSLGGQRRR